MADNADIANDRIEIGLEQSLAVLRLARPLSFEKECVECKDLIPAERTLALLEVGCSRCVDCQQVYDQRNRMVGRRAYG